MIRPAALQLAARSGAGRERSNRAPGSALTRTAGASIDTPPRFGGVAGWLRRQGQLIVGLLVSAWSLWLLAQSIEPDKVGAQLVGANLALLALCFATIPLSMVLKAIRWRYLFPDGAAPSILPLVSSLYIGYLINTVLPARVGELVRAYLVGRERGVGIPVALATVVVEKVLDVLSMLLILGGLIAFRQLPYIPDWLQLSGALVIVAGLLALALMIVLRRQVLAIVAFVEQRLPLLRPLHPTALASSFLEGLAGLGRRRTLPGLLFWSVATWASATVTMWSGLAAVGLEPGLSAVLLVLVVSNLGMVVTSAPCYVGWYHWVMKESLLPFGVDPNHAVGAAIVMHALVFGNFILGGLWFLWRGGYSLGGLRQVSGQESSTSASL